MTPLKQFTDWFAANCPNRICLWEKKIASSIFTCYDTGKNNLLILQTYEDKGIEVWIPINPTNDLEAMFDSLKRYLTA